MNISWIFMAVTSCWWSVSMGQEDFCDATLCRNGLPHVVCTGTEQFQGTCPPTAETIPMSQAIRELLVNLHNQRRSQVASGSLQGFPGASNMLEISWDDTLSKVAGFNARGCVMKHDECRNTHRFRLSGQNLGIREQTNEFENTDNAITRMVNMWFEEYRVCPLDVIGRYRKSTDTTVFGHFTQMVQDKSDRLGCASVRYSKDGWFSTYLVCNYAHTNLLNEKVYETGHACSGCPGKCSTANPGLCVSSPVEAGTPLRTVQPERSPSVPRPSVESVRRVYPVEDVFEKPVATYETELDSLY